MDEENEEIIDEVRVEDVGCGKLQGMGGLGSGVGLKIVFGEVSKTGFFYLEKTKYFGFFHLAKNLKNLVISH